MVAFSRAFKCDLELARQTDNVANWHSIQTDPDQFKSSLNYMQMTYILFGGTLVLILDKVVHTSGHPGHLCGPE